MASVVVIGAGLGGLSTAMLLALDGHDVIVLERNPAEPPVGPDEAWQQWERPGVNQFRLPHFLLARFREVAAWELLDAVAALDDWGALRFDPIGSLPSEITGGARPGDERLSSITARRPVIEAALATTAQATYGVTVRRGVAVSGLTTGCAQAAAIPHVTGVVTDSGEQLDADLVVDATGRRSPLADWLSALGATAVERREDCGFVYYGRHYRGDALPTMFAGIRQDYESVSLLTLPADNNTWSVTFITSARDSALRRLKDPACFDTALDLYPAVAHWKQGTPITPGVDVMAKIEDRFRRFVVDGRPVVTGLVAVADAVACTNPSLGRGATLGLLHACALRDLLREVHTSDPVAFAVRWDELTEEIVTPVYQQTVSFDRHRLAEIDAEIDSRPYDTDDPAWAMSTALLAGAATDPDLLRALVEVAGMLASPSEVFGRPGMLEAVVGAAELPRYPVPGPNRGMLLDAIAT